MPFQCYILSPTNLIYAATHILADLKERALRKFFSIPTFLERRAAWVEGVSEDRLMEELTTYYIKGGLDHSPVFDDRNSLHDLSSFEKVFHSLAASKEGSTPYWSESILISFLARSFPQDPPLVYGAGAVLYKSAAYHAAYPFPSQAPVMLTHDALLRAVVMLTGREQRILRGSSMSYSADRGDIVMQRGRQELDRRRLMFRSLAMEPRAAKTIDTLLEKVAFPQESACDTFRDQNMGSGNEENMEDLLDVLAAIQPNENPCLMTIPREDLRPAALRLLSAQPPLENLRLHHDGFAQLLKLLLLLQLRGARKGHLVHFSKYLHQFLLVSECILKPFTTSESLEDGIPYSIFETVISRTMPNLFQGLPWLFETFLGNPTSTEDDYVYNKPPPSRIVTLPVLSQLSFFLPQCQSRLPYECVIYKTPDEFNLGFHIPAPNHLSHLRLLWARSINGSDPKTLTAAISASDSGSLIILSGTSSLFSSKAAETMIYGAYMPRNWLNGGLLAPSSTSKDSDETEALLFQLAPVHDVFHSTHPIPKRSVSDWRKPAVPKLPSRPMQELMDTSDGIVFGRPGPVTLRLNSGLSTATFTHIFGGEGEGAYLPNPRRGDFQDTIGVEEIEVWYI